MYDRMSHATVTLPLVLGGLGLRSAVRTSPSAFWASWADCPHMVHQRHPAASALLVHHLDGGTDTPHLGAPLLAARALEGVQGFGVPSWPALAMGHRPPQNLDEFEIDDIRERWQHEAASRVERDFRERTILPCLADGERALLRSQSFSGAGVALSTDAPTGSVRLPAVPHSLVPPPPAPTPPRTALLPVWPSH